MNRHTTERIVNGRTHIQRSAVIEVWVALKAVLCVALRSLLTSAALDSSCNRYPRAIAIILKTCEKRNNLTFYIG